MAKPFTKNDPRINRTGRKKGVGNRSSEQLRKAIHEFIDSNFDEIQADFDSLEALQRLNFIDKLLSHVLPKPITSLNDLSEADLDILLEKLKNQHNGKSG